MSDPVLMARIAALEARVASLESGAGSYSSSAGVGGKVADDRDLDSQYGDPLVKKDPPRWDGASYAGCHMSECPTEYLRTLADFYDWQADRDDAAGKKYTPKKPGAQPRPASLLRRQDAARARGWAKRNEGRVAGGSSNDDTGDPDPSADEIPF